MTAKKTKKPELTLEFPLSIGLIGAPGAGKQDVIAEVLKISQPWFESHGKTLLVNPNAGNVLQEEYDIAAGWAGGWNVDVRAFMTRENAEDTLRAQGASFISSGTPIEHLAHCGVNLETLMGGFQTPEKEQQINEYKVAMTTLTYLFLQGFRYLFGFYLPHPGEGVIVPGVDNSEKQYGARVDNGLRHVFANFGLRIQPLTGTSVEENAQTIFDTVKEIMENGPPKPEEVEETAVDEELVPVSVEEVMGDLVEVE